MRGLFLLMAIISITSAPSIAFAQSDSGRGLPMARDGEFIDSIGSGAIDDILPIVQNENGISYLTGGVSDEELAYIKEQEKNFNVRILVRAAVSGEYLSELTVRFVDKQNVNVLTVEQAGPYIYANLPVGIYNVEITTIKGNVQKLKVKATAKPKDKVYVTFK